MPSSSLREKLRAFAVMAEGIAGMAQGIASPAGEAAPGDRIVPQSSSIVIFAIYSISASLATSLHTAATVKATARAQCAAGQAAAPRPNPHANPVAPRSRNTFMRARARRLSALWRADRDSAERDHALLRSAIRAGIVEVQLEH
jgi:hypothetical protein